MNDACDRLGAALDDLWQQIRWPIDGLLAHPWPLVAYAVICVVAIAIDLLLR